MRTLTGKKEIEEFFKRFPYITGPLPGWATKKVRCPCDITVKYEVSVADAEALYFQPETHLPPKNWIYSEDKNYCGQISATAYAIGKEGWQTDYLEFCDDRTKSPFLKGVIKKRDIKAVTLVIKHSWWAYNKNWQEERQSSPAKNLHHQEYEIYIFKEPVCGFSELVRLAKLDRNVQITNIAKIREASFRNIEAFGAIKRLDKLIGEFENEVNPYLWKRIEKLGKTKLEGSFSDGTSLTTDVSYDSIFMELSNAFGQMSLIGNRLSKERTFINTMNCTADLAEQMIDDVTYHRDSFDLFLKPR